MPIRILLADNHALVRAGIRSLLEHRPGLEVVGEAADGIEALDAVERLSPDVVLMDVAMPEMNGLEATAQLARTQPRVRVLILSMHANEEYVHRALAAGAAGYLLKDAEKEELEWAVQSVARGATYLTPAISATLVQDYLAGRRDGASIDRLTPRQRQVLQLIAEGNTTRAIATKLGLSAKTVETHRSQLMQRLEIFDVAGLVRYAIRMHITSPDT